MRLYDTATRQLQELPPPPGPIRMYFCGPTVYQRIHIGNARPFVISMWLKRWLERSGYEVTLVENITDINDKIYAAAPGASAKLAADASGWYVEDTGGLGLGRPDVEPKATESIPEIVAMIEQLVSTGHAYPAGGDVYFRVASFPDYGKLSGRHGDEEATRNPSEEDEEAALKEDPRDFALWKAHKEGEDTWWDSPWGRGRPGWHIECSAMAEEHLGPVFEIHGGGLDLDLPAPRERGRAVALARPRLRAALDAQRDAAAGRREDVEVARQHRLAARGAGRVGPRDAARLLPRRPLAQADRLLGRGARPGGGAGRELPQRLPGRVGARRRLGPRLPPRSRTTSTRPRRSRSCTAGAITSCCGAGWRSSGSSRWPRARRRRPSWRSCAPSARGGPRAEGLRRGRPAARRDRGGRLGRARRRRRARLPARPEAVTRELVYGRRPGA